MEDNTDRPLRLLAVDDDSAAIELLRHYSTNMGGFAYSGFTSSVEALAWAKDNAFDVAIVDHKMPGADGLHLLKRLKQLRPDALYIMMTAHNDVCIAIEAIRIGISDFLQKPVDMGIFTSTMRRLIKQLDLNMENETLKEYFNNPHPLIGVSPQMIVIREKIKLFAPSDSPLLITGETGTGKEVVARAIHHESKRRKFKFVPLNCGSFPEALLESELFGHEKGAFTGAQERRIGKFEYCGKGVIFLDEIGEMQPHLETRLLRVIQEKEFERVGGNTPIAAEARIISATNKDLRKGVEEGTFRKDLFYRLNGLQIHIPPLRERPEDIEPLTQHFVKKYSTVHKKRIKAIHDKTTAVLRKYEWPGNVRQLESVIDYAVMLCDGEELRNSHIPENIFLPILATPRVTAVPSDISPKAHPFDKQKILSALREAKGNKSKAALNLGITRAQLLYRISKLNIPS